MSGYWSELLYSIGGWVTFSMNFRGMGSQKTIVPGLSRGTFCVIVCLAVLTQYQHVTDRRIDRLRHDNG